MFLNPRGIRLVVNSHFHSHSHGKYPHACSSSDGQWTDIYTIRPYCTATPHLHATGHGHTLLSGLLLPGVNDNPNNPNNPNNPGVNEVKEFYTVSLVFANKFEVVCRAFQTLRLIHTTNLFCVRVGCSSSCEKAL